MISVPAGVRILLAARPVDFRRGAHALAALAAETLGEDPFSGTVLAFRARRGDRVKILLWDTSGLVLVWKRMQRGGFVWPPVADGVVRLSAAGACRGSGGGADRRAELRLPGVRHAAGGGSGRWGG